MDMYTRKKVNFLILLLLEKQFQRKESKKLLQLYLVSNSGRAF